MMTHPEIETTLCSLRVLLSAAMALASIAVQAAPLAVDTAASEIKVTFTQMNVPVGASFTEFQADASFDGNTPAEARTRLVINTASFDFGPGAEEYNAEVRKPEWFDTSRFPTAVFEGNGARALDGGRYEVAGSVTIKGVTRPLAAPFTLSEKDGRWVFEGQVPIKRLAFGLGADEWKDTSILADDVIVRFRVVATAP